MVSKNYDVIVVGAGISGLLSALILSKHGYRVLLIEKEKDVGGNCRSYEVDGFRVDTGPHAITSLNEGGPLPLIMDGYFDVVPTFKPYGDYYIRSLEGKITRCPTNVADFLKFDFLPPKDRFLLSSKIASVIFKSASGTDFSKVSISEALPRGLSEKTHSLANTFSYFMSGRDMNETSVQRMLNGGSFTNEVADTEQKIISYMKCESCVQPFSKKSNPTAGTQDETPLKAKSPKLRALVTHKGGFNRQGYPLGGIGSIVKCITESMPENVEIRTNCRTTKILTENGKTVGVECVRSDIPWPSKEIYMADLVVYTGFAGCLKRMVDNLPKQYIDKIDNIDHTIGLTTWIGLDTCVPEFNYIGSEIHFEIIPSWGGPMSNYDESLAPNGQQLAGFGFAPIPRKKIRKNKDHAYDALFEMLPKIEKHVVMKHEQITVPEKAAITLTGEFASVRTPIPGLYMAGTDTDKRSMGITRASYSVINMVYALWEDGYFKHKNEFKGNNVKRRYLPNGTKL